MKTTKTSKYILITFLLLAIIACNNPKENIQDLSKLLYLAEITHNFNDYQEWFADENIYELCTIDTLTGKIKGNKLKYHYGRQLLFKKDTIDSLHQLLAGTLWLDKKNKPIDTMTYTNSTTIVSADAVPSERLKNQIMSYVDVLSKIQVSLILIKAEVEKQRPGTKNEKVICQNCTILNSSETIKNTNNMAELYLETENQFTIIYRELRCTAFAVSLLDKRKTATNNYKIRI